jgi:hypothetical protein
MNQAAKYAPGRGPASQHGAPRAWVVGWYGAPDWAGEDLAASSASATAAAGGRGPSAVLSAVMEAVGGAVLPCLHCRQRPEAVSDSGEQNASAGTLLGAVRRGHRAQLDISDVQKCRIAAVCGVMRSVPVDGSRAQILSAPPDPSITTSTGIFELAACCPARCPIRERT